jgi:hypothetical protein
VLIAGGLPRGDNRRRMPSGTWTDWLTREASYRYGAWIFLAIGVALVVYVVRALVTGRVLNVSRVGPDEMQMLLPPDDEHDRRTATFNYWHSMVLLAAATGAVLWLSAHLFALARG